MHLVTKLWRGRKQDSACWEEGIPVYDCSRVEAVFMLVGRDGDQLIFRFLTVKGIPSKRSQLTCMDLVQKKKWTYLLLKP